jgi:predicted phosphodiesterase
MRILVISDIHANLPAFQAVLEDAKGKWDQIWCLGDLIGYGPHPNECVTLLREYDHISLSGNHDWAVMGRIDINTFNKEAKRVVEWTRQNITQETMAYLQTLPSILIKPPFTLAHASPRQPVWEYILDAYTAAINFDYFDTPYCLVGHTHVPIIFEEMKNNEIGVFAPALSPQVLNGHRRIINPGSVGQPRDTDPRASYALLNTDTLTWEYCRVPYPIAETQKAMRDAGLPKRLIKRLEYGW